MFLHKVEIYNFKSHKKTIVSLSENMNVLIGQNNTGKTSFLQALNYAIGYKKAMPSEDDFYAGGDEEFDPKLAEPIKIIVEFREIFQPLETIKIKRFPESMVSIFDNAIIFDEEISEEEEHIRYFKICYEFKYDNDKGKYEDYRYFVDEENEQIQLPENSEVNDKYLSFFPFFYLESMRDINKEIRSKTSFWGKIKTVIDYKDKEEEEEYKEEEETKEEKIKKLIEQLNSTILKENNTILKVMERLKELENNIRIEPDSISLNAFTKRSWELLDDLNIYLKLPYSKLSLPISKHGEGTQNIIILLIFTAYLEILLPQILGNPDATPIIGLEEPEAHIHPQAQRALFNQIKKMSGQKIMSTHSPYIVDQADIYDYIIFNVEEGITKLNIIPYYKPSFKLKSNLPEEAYQNNKFLTKDEELKIKRYIKFKNTELFFSSLFILFEGDSEKIFLDRIIPYYTGKSLGEMGISLISCEGKLYSPFLKISNSKAFKLNWLILSDADHNTKEEVENTINNSGYKYDNVKEKIFYLPDEDDFEKCYLSFYKSKKILKVITSDKKLKTSYKKFKWQKLNKVLNDEQSLSKFLNITKFI